MDGPYYAARSTRVPRTSSTLWVCRSPALLLRSLVPVAGSSRRSEDGRAYRVLATFIRDHHEEIIREFALFARTLMPSGADMTEAELRDHAEDIGPQSFTTCALRKRAKNSLASLRDVAPPTSCEPRERSTRMIASITDSRSGRCWRSSARSARPYCACTPKAAHLIAAEVFADSSPPPSAPPRCRTAFPRTGSYAGRERQPSLGPVDKPLDAFSLRAAVGAIIVRRRWPPLIHAIMTTGAKNSGLLMFARRHNIRCGR